MVRKTISFEEAVEREELRQRFIDQFSKPFYVQEVRYEANQVDGMAMMLALPHYLTNFYVPGTAGSILVLPNSFPGKHGNLDDFSSSLQDHEYFHARDYFFRPAHSITPAWTLILLYITNNMSLKLKGLQSLTKKYLNTEIRACENQIRNFKKRNCSEDYMNHIMDLRDYQLDQKSDFDKGLGALIPYTK